MTLSELRELTRLYLRDQNGFLFTNTEIDIFINQAIDRLLQTPSYFNGMEKLTDSDDVPNLLPPQYHYILALFAASRLFDIDERFYEGTERRNEFEDVLGQIIDDINSGELYFLDEDGNPLCAAREEEVPVNTYFINSRPIRGFIVNESDE